MTPDRQTAALVESTPPAHLAWRTLVGLGLALVAAAAGAQTEPVILSIAQVPASDDSRHEILPVAEFDGIRFRPVREPTAAPAASSRRELLLERFPRVQVLYRGAPIGVVEIDEIDTRNLLFCSETIGRGSYLSDRDLPSSEITRSLRVIDDGEREDHRIQHFLALSGAIGAPRPGSEPGSGDEPLVTAVTDPAALAAYEQDVAGFAPRPELAPLGRDETRAYRFDRLQAVLVIRSRQSAGTVVGPGNSAIEPPLYTDIVIVRTGGGQRSVVPLSGASARTDAFNTGTDPRYLDAFELANGTVYLAFDRRDGAAARLALYELGAISATRLVLAAEYGC